MCSAGVQNDCWQKDGRHEARDLSGSAILASQAGREISAVTLYWPGCFWVETSRYASWIHWGGSEDYL
jgi:hypothetical protein